MTGASGPLTSVLMRALSSSHIAQSLVSKKCIERATTLEAVGDSDSGYTPADPAISKWVYFKGLSEDSWWSVKPEPWNEI